MVRYRCHTGHVYSAETLLSSQNEDLERALWTALRVLVEKAALANRLMLRAKESENAEMESYYAAQARDAEEQAQHIRRALSTAKERSRSAKSPGEEVNENITQTKG